MMNHLNLLTYESWIRPRGPRVAIRLLTPIRK
jgi:hypothetical protein